ncbi:MAG: hypothetical protein N2B03_05100 [Boseongicola sp.]
MKRASLILVTTTALVACSPMSPERAADFCEDRARAAAGPTGQVRIWVGSGGNVHTGLDVAVTTDFLKGSDPYFVYEDCVRRKSGQGPIRPLML